jgi:hypothetical protein
MQAHFVLYRRADTTAPCDPPFVFPCFADDADHAEEQLLNAEPVASVLWVSLADTPDDALQEYWNA